MSVGDEEIEVFQLLLPQDLRLVGNLAAAIDQAAEAMDYEALLRVRDDPDRPVIVLKRARTSRVAGDS